MKAAQWTNLDLVKSLLELPRAKKAINARDCNFCTAVTYATKQQSPGTIEVVKALFDAGANVNVDDGKSPLHVATDCNVIRLLVDAGADMDMTDEHGFPPLYYRCADGDTDAFKLLLSLGACVDVDGDMGMEILSLTLHDNRVDMMNALLPYLTDLRGDPDHIGSPVFEAARRSYSRAACAFLAAWGWEDVTDDDGQTALMVCCGTEVAQQLLDGGVRVDDEDDLGRTALHHACLLGSDEMVSFLLKNGADPSALDSESKTPLRLACENKRLRAVIALLSAKHSSMEWIDEYCEDDSTALHIAVKKDYCEIVACLLAAGAKQIPDGDGNMPLHLAKSSHVVRMLLEAGAKDVKDRSGYTALMHACKGNNSVIVQLLSDPKYGCDVNAVNNGETALSLAFQHSSLDASPVLLSSPLLDANQRVDESGRTVTPKRRKM
jgi:ankyrin repeat protein